MREFYLNPIKGTGLGLRSNHFDDVLNARPSVPWFEVLADNFLVSGGPVLQKLETIRSDYPITSHSVGLSLGSTDPLNQDYIQSLKEFIDRFQPFIVSDHLCWTGVHGVNLHELMPLPYTQETIDHVVNRIDAVQNSLGRQLIIENVSSYLTYRNVAMTEWEFLTAIVKKSGCGLLLDINNIFVSSVNHQFSPKKYVDAMKGLPIQQYHLAGFQDKGTYLFDDHGDVVSPSVWNLYQYALEVLGDYPALIEWDNNIPDFDILLNEMYRAEKCRKKVKNLVYEFA